MNKPILLPPYFMPSSSTDPAQGNYAAPLPPVDPNADRLVKLEKRADNLDKEIAHVAGTIRKVEGALLEQQRMFTEAMELLDLERTLYARKLDELQGLVKRLLELKG